MSCASTLTLGDIVTLQDFQQLLSDEEFVDFFNKFICLPAFSQMVQISRKECRFLLFPPLPNSHTVNDKGLIEWLWRKRLTFFIRSKFFGEYRLCNILIHHSLLRERGQSSKTENVQHIQKCLRWLQKQSLGRVSKLRKFRNFLRNCENGLKMYIYWLDAERLYFHIKLRSNSAVEVFKSIRVKYFNNESDWRMPQHLLEAALECLPPFHRNKGIAADAISYDVTFAMCLQRICTNRLKGYWLPRFLLEQKSLAKNEEENKTLKTALKYLRGTLKMESNHDESGSESPELSDVEDKESVFSDDSHSYKDKLYGRNDKNTTAARKEREESNSSNKYTYPDDEARKHRRVFIKYRPTSTSGTKTKQQKKRLITEDVINSSSEDEENSKPKIRPMRANSRQRKDGRKSGSRARSRQKSGYESECDMDSDYDVDKFVSSYVNNGHKRVREENVKDLDDYRARVLQKRKLKYENLFCEPNLSRRPPTPAEKLKQIYKDVDESHQQIFEEYDEKLLRFPIYRPAEITKSDITCLNMSSTDSKSMLKTIVKHRGKDFHPVSVHSGHVLEDFNKGSDSNPNGAWDISEEEFSRRLSAKPWELSESLNNLRPSRRNLLVKSEKVSRRAVSPPRVEEIITQPSLKRRKSSVRAKPRKPNTTKVTFSLSGGKPVPPPPPDEKGIKTQDAAFENRKLPRHDKFKKRIPLQRVEKRPILPEIVTERSIAQLEEFTMERDNAYRRHPHNARMILALQSDQCASQPFRTYLIITGNTDLISCLSLWQDVEKTRQDFQYGDMTFENFLHSMQEIIGAYLLHNSPCRIDAPERLREQVITSCMNPDMQEMPWQMRELQKQAMEDLKSAYQEFTEHETQSLFNAAALKKSGRTRRTQKARGFLPAILDSHENEGENLDESSKQISDDNDIAAQMIVRMIRSLDYLIETNLPDGRESTTTPVNPPESDEDGFVDLPSDPVDVVDPPTDYTDLASRSVKQYPGEKYVCGKYFNAPKTARRPLPAIAQQDPPLKKIRPVIERPVYRPKTFQEVLKDPAHLHFFNRYLKAYRADIPLRFWNAVEKMNKMEKNKFKQIHARKISNKYFHNSKTPATVLLQSDGDIIREISKREVAPINRLVAAQATIQKDLEERWFERYAGTFLDMPTYNSRYDVTSINDETLLYRNRKLKGICSVIRVFIKRAGSFLRNMKKPHMFKLFEKFLQKEMEEGTSPSKSEAPMDLFDNRSDSTLSPVLYLRRDWDTRVKQRVIAGRIITFNFLMNDLHFWRDVESFRKLVYEFSTDTELSSDLLRENVLLCNKAKLIVSCYLDSDILPKVRVNVPTEAAKVSIESLRNGGVDYGMFHESTVAIFPVLLDFWRRFCTEYYNYIPTLSKKHQKIYGYKMTPRIAEQRRNTKKPDVPEEGGDSKRTTSHMSTSRKHMHMDQANFTMKRISPMGLEEMGLRLTFSLRQGVTLIQPSLRKRLNADNPSSFADHEELRGRAE